MELLKPNEVSVRVAQILNGIGVGGIFLLYANARTVMDRLDKEYTQKGWQSSFAGVNGVLYCTISVWDKEKKQWVSKSNAGEKSNISAEKGEASDAFKRAATMWGIGRELYTAPFIWIKLNPDETVSRKGKLVLTNNAHFSVKKLEYDENNQIKSLDIVDKTGKVRFSMDSKFSKVNEMEKQEETARRKKLVADIATTANTLNSLDLVSGIIEFTYKKKSSAEMTTDELKDLDENFNTRLVAYKEANKGAKK
jgi:hypothetical protein